MTEENNGNCMARIPSKRSPNTYNHSCVLQDGHKGKHQCACEIQWYGKMRFKI